MIAYNSNASEVLNVISNKLNKAMSEQETDKMLRKIASTLTAVLRVRVHQNGIAADGSKIGTYSPEYMKVRTGQFSNATRVKSGKNKGKSKDAGVVTRGENKGQQRKKYNRTSDTKVILSLTRQMEQDMTTCERNPIKIPYGYAIGYANEDNYNKLIWNEQRYGKKILTKLSAEEEDLVDIMVENAIATN